MKIIATENERAVKMAALFRARVKAGLTYNIEIQHQPVGSHRFQRSGGVGYDETCYHRNFVAVKCQNERDADKIPDAWNQAVAASEAHNILIHEKEVQKQKMQELDMKRTQTAKKAQLMDQKRKILDEEIKELVIDDRLRRKANAGKYAGFFRNMYFEVGERDLVQRFEKQFQIGIYLVFLLTIDDGNQFDAPPKHFPVRVNQDKGHQSLENSIEIVKGAENLKVLRGNTFNVTPVKPGP